MKLAINQIKVKKNRRLRRELGDLESLQASIQELGLLNPIVVDEHYTLVAGFRRLSACAKLGWQEVDVRVVVFDDDQLKALDAEMAENYFRKDFTPEEIRDGELRRHQIVESMRKKSWWERLVLWFKGLFGGAKQDPEVDVTTTIHEELGIAEQEEAEASSTGTTEQAGTKTADAEPLVEEHSSVADTKTNDEAAPPQPEAKPEEEKGTPKPAGGEQEEVKEVETEELTPADQKGGAPDQETMAPEHSKSAPKSQSLDTQKPARDVRNIFPDPRASK
jgi:ParB family chromosome partitioning protein